MNNKIVKKTVPVRIFEKNRSWNVILVRLHKVFW
ncbi:MAG: hypothetical protein BWY71_01379 [Planctomycetes bacterium ADurb.Bin412]|nr:MAG: hypothetical protein BWY71_01379 [Planctomycetes bacterium ADurb.Bin412]